MTRGEDKLGSYSKTKNSVRCWCTVCGGHVLTERPSMGLTDVYAAIMPGLAFEPGVQVNYQGTVLHIKDGLPKLRDFPAEIRGSGETLPE